MHRGERANTRKHRNNRGTRYRFEGFLKGEASMNNRYKTNRTNHGFKSLVGEREYLPRVKSMTLKEIKEAQGLVDEDMAEILSVKLDYYQELEKGNYPLTARHKKAIEKVLYHPAEKVEGVSRVRRKKE